MRFYTTMKGDVDISEETPPPSFSWADAGILAGAILAILMGVSVLSTQAATIIGIGIMLFVIYKLFTTKT